MSHLKSDSAVFIFLNEILVCLGRLLGLLNDLLGLVLNGGINDGPNHALNIAGLLVFAAVLEAARRKDRRS